MPYTVSSRRVQIDRGAASVELCNIPEPERGFVFRNVRPWNGEKPDNAEVFSIVQLLIWAYDRSGKPLPPLTGVWHLIQSTTGQQYCLRLT